MRTVASHLWRNHCQDPWEVCLKLGVWVSRMATVFIVLLSVFLSIHNNLGELRVLSTCYKLGRFRVGRRVIQVDSGGFWWILTLPIEKVLREV